MEQALSVTFSNGEEDKRLVEGNNVGDEDIYIYMTVYVMRILGLMVIVVIH